MTNENYEIIEDVTQGVLHSAYVAAPFGEGKTALEAKGYRIPTLEENARLRIQEGGGSNVSRNGNWVSEDFVYVPSKGIYLTKKSPIMVNPREATEAHRNNIEYFLTDEQVQEALSDSIEVESDQNSITAYAFGNFAKKYEEFLKENHISYIYLPKLYQLPMGEEEYQMKKIFENDGVNIYKVLE